ncbi:MAG TPA: hypothetical protein VK550_16190 [Polyangiaceae bacterium]|nr:hypothetical protein [Polyangiaceae bacterium]
MKLSSRDLAIIDRACRYRILVVEVVTRHFFSNGSPEAARSVLRRLERAGFLSRHRFLRREPYYQPSQRALLMSGDLQSKARPVGAQTLPRLLGVLLFASFCPTPAVRLRADELRTLCPELHAGHPALTGIQDFVRIDGGTVDEITRVVVDLGGDHRGFAFKLRRTVNEMLSERAFQRLRDEHRLTLSLVFSSEAKRDAVRRLLERHAIPIPLRFVVVSTLFEVLCGSRLAMEEAT